MASFRSATGSRVAFLWVVAAVVVGVPKLPIIVLSATFFEKTVVEEMVADVRCKSLVFARNLGRRGRGCEYKGSSKRLL